MPALPTPWRSSRTSAIAPCRNSASWDRQRALALDSSLADAHVALGIMHTSLGRYAAGEAELKRAIAIEPANAGAHFQLGRLLLYVGRVRESIEELERAKSLEPYQPATATWLGYALLRSANPERASAEAARAWELDSPSAVVQLITAMTALESGRPTGARQFASGGRTRTSFNRGTFAYVLGMTGAVDSTRDTIRMIGARGGTQWLDQMNLAFAAQALGDPRPRTPSTSWPARAATAYFHSGRSSSTVSGTAIRCVGPARRSE